MDINKPIETSTLGGGNWRPDMTYHIATTYRVTIRVPFAVWDYVFRRRLEDQWNRDIVGATEGNVGAGQNSYAEVEEWADFTEMKEAQRAGDRMLAVLASYRTMYERALAGEEDRA